jgi:cupin 2 domain-containing protein
MSRGNIFDGIPGGLSGLPEFVERLAGGSDVRIERIVSRGHVSPSGLWYDQKQSEWVMVVTGRARVRFESGQTVELAPGDHLTIAAHERHRVDWTDPDCDTVWIAVFY